jgi:hypothetical protein
MLTVFFSSLESVDDDELRSHIAMRICAFVHDRGEFQELFLALFGQHLNFLKIINAHVQEPLLTQES